MILRRTRLITEEFRVEADTLDEAVDMLANCDTVACMEGVEQTELSTVHSEIEQVG